MSDSENERQPLACDRGALDPQQRRRHEELWKRVDESSDGSEATEDGVAFRVPRDRMAADELRELATLEQVCCPFLEVKVTALSDDGPLLLELAGHGEITQLLAGEGLTS